MKNKTYEMSTEIEVSKDSIIQALYLSLITLQNKVDELTDIVNEIKKPKMLDVNDVIKFYDNCSKKTAYNIMHDPDLVVFDRGHKLLVQDTELYRYQSTKPSPASKRYWNEIEIKNSTKNIKKGA